MTNVSQKLSNPVMAILSKMNIRHKGNTVWNVVDFCCSGIMGRVRRCLWSM